MLDQLEDQYLSADDYNNEAVIGKALKNDDLLLGTDNNFLENQYRIMQLQEQALQMATSQTQKNKPESPQFIPKVPNISNIADFQEVKTENIKITANHTGGAMLNSKNHETMKINDANIDIEAIQARKESNLKQNSDLE